MAIFDAIFSLKSQPFKASKLDRASFSIPEYLEILDDKGTEAGRNPPGGGGGGTLPPVPPGPDKTMIPYQQV